MCEDCRPLGFLLGLPFMLVAFALTLIGIVLWIITLVSAPSLFLIPSFFPSSFTVRPPCYFTISHPFQTPELWLKKHFARNDH
jgi:hypothetical protein